jgi:two-component system chemotaxis response regulator CheB
MIVVGTTQDGESTLERVRTLKPDLVTMDVTMPKLDGVEATRRIMSSTPTPIAVITAASIGPGTQVTFNAIEAGAVAVLQKPSRAELVRSPEARKVFLQQLRNVASVGVVGIRGGRAGISSIPSPPEGERTTPASLFEGKRLTPCATTTHSRCPSRASVIGIGASTGGPPVVKTILESIHEHSPPVLLVQHMSEAFVSGYATWLNSVVPVPVKVAEAGELLKTGHVYVAPGDRHLLVEDRGRVSISNAPPVNYQQPAVDLLFESLAHTYGSQAIGVLLTGMGRDGAMGLKCMYDTGAFTVTQCETSSLVYGMPKAAVELGASRLATMPLHIGRLLRGVQRLDRVAGR